MLSRISDVAANVVSQLSRRSFFRKVANAALPLAALMGGILASPRESEAQANRWMKCCYYQTTLPGRGPRFGKACVRRDADCPSGTGWILTDFKHKRSCDLC